MNARNQKGFGAIVAIVVVVILAAMSVAILKFGWGQQMGSAQDIQGARANQVARAGLEWGLYQALHSGGAWKTSPCPDYTSAPSTQTLDLRSATGFSVTVSCNSQPYNEGESAPGTAATVRFYKIQAIACNAASCPDNTQATSIAYIERARMALVTN